MTVLVNFPNFVGMLHWMVECGSVSMHGPYFVNVKTFLAIYKLEGLFACRKGGNSWQGVRDCGKG